MKKLLILCLLLPFGCGKPEAPSESVTLAKAPVPEYVAALGRPVSVTPESLQRTITNAVSEKAWLNSTVYFGDKAYAYPTKRWLFNSFLPWQRQAIRSLGLNHYAANYDCDNFADALRCMAQMANMRAEGTEALAVARISYKKAGGGRHAINLVVLGPDKVVFIEPQTSGEVWLSGSEKDSISFILF